MYRQGYRQIVGLDEVGRGAIAGPLTVGAVEINLEILGVNDSKLIAVSKREKLAEQIKAVAKQVNIGQASNEEIDALGVSKALMLAYDRALENIEADLLLTDFIYLPGRKHLRAIKGDSLFYPVAAASIVAKVYRDNLMKELANKFPDFGWETNVGYGTKSHLAAIKKYGVSPHHRKTFLNKKMGPASRPT